MDVQAEGVARSGKAGAGDGNRTRDLLFTNLQPYVVLGFFSAFRLVLRA